MINRELERRLHPVAERVRRVRLWATLGIVWLAAGAVGVILLMIGPALGWRTDLAAALLAIAALLAAIAGAFFVRRSELDYRRLARRIEKAYPSLDAGLLTAVEQQPGADGRYGFLQQEVLREAYIHSCRRPWAMAVPTSRLALAHAVNIGGLLLLAGVLAGLVVYRPAIVPGLPTLDFEQVAVVENPTYSASIEPGSTEVERGTSLLVLARFRGHLPPEATLVYVAESGEERRVKMSRSLDDPVFGGRILAVAAPLEYRVEYGRQQSDTFQLTVFDYPRLERADALLAYPDYTQLDEKLVQDVRRVSAVEGTRLTLLCRLNKPVAEAALAEKEGQTIELSADPADPLLWRATLVMDRSRRLTLHLADEEGRPNQSPPEFVFNALPNRPADLKLVLPARDMQVSPIEELDVAASAWDDYGLARVGLSFAMAGSDVRDVVLGESLAAKERAPLEHLLSFEKMNAEPDQLVSYFFWAEDIGPGGEIRRTSGDMYFAEVRHFEEIFRQGQQPTEDELREQREQREQQQGQQGGQNAQEAERLAELQKQIINGTWKVIRRETRDEPTEEFAGDLQLLLESQLSALEQVDALGQEVTDPESLTHVEAVRSHMQEAATRLGEAGGGPSIDALNPALAAEQSAYQALLKLRAREHEVVRASQQQQQQGQQSQSQSASQSANSRSQQQLNELELREDENRYETENTALPQEPQEQREDRQVLNRLRDLAQRQHDLNDRIKELQSALEEAETPAEREEIEQQLKRLEDEQQQILRDTEELQQRMEQPENQERMAEQRQQLEQARENARQSSQSLQERQVSRAAAQGTRAEQELRELQDEFQRRTSGQFSEEMRGMQQQARELQQREEELAERLGELDGREESPSLDGENQREQVAEELTRQGERVDDLLERMRRTVEEAEETEPLLAEELYDTIRDTRRQSPREALDSAEESLSQGLVEDARDQEVQAREGIAQLREGIDRAAESVLGDETESLRRAEAELERLSEELEDEIARAGGGPREAGERPASSGRSPASQSGEPTEPGEETAPSEPGEETPPGEPGEGGQPGEQGRPGGQSGEPREPGEGEPAGGGRPGAEGREQPPREGQPAEPREGAPGNPPSSGRQDGERTDPRGGERTADAGGGGLDRFLGGGGNERIMAPLSGEDFLDWSDRLRDVEEMLSDPELRAEAARIRDAAKEIRKEVKRHSAPPNWDVVQEMVAEPLADLEDRVAEELLRRTSQDSLAPIDRDPVPPKYEDRVRRYYERLGKGE